MPTPSNQIPRSLGLRAGDLVEVRSAEEILATLDENGELDQMPFMPEMLAYCEKQFHVFKRADKTCDTIYFRGMRRLTNTVHLEDQRCDGSAHGGCQARCLMFWKEAWLKRPSMPSVPRSDLLAGRCTIARLMEKTRKSSDSSDPAEATYSCQATELLRCTTRLSPWDVRQYARDLITGNAKLSKILRYFAVTAFNWLQRLRGGGEYPSHFQTSARPVEGKTPKEVLNVQPGEIVQIRSRDEILATLDVRNRNRGLWFDGEMVKFCGGKYRVSRRVNTIISEVTGKMMHLQNDCIVLEGVACESDYHAMCPRQIHAYWREIWLRKEGPQPDQTIKT